MANTSPSLSARIRALEAAKSRAAALPRKARLSFEPMMELLAVSRPVLRGWCNEIEGFEQSGAYVRGGNGMEWDFDPRKTVTFLLRHFTGRLTAQATKSRAISKAIGVTLPAEEAPSLAETKQMVDLTLSLVAAAEKQNRYTPTEDMIAFLTGYNQRVLDGIMGVRTQVDPNGNLPVHVRKAVDGYLRTVATQVHEMAEQFIGSHREGLQQAGTR